MTPTTEPSIEPPLEPSPDEFVEPVPAQWFCDRSRITTYWKCPRQRWYQYHYNGRGIVSSGIHLELYLGSSLHDGLAAIAIQQKSGASVDIDLIGQTAQAQIFEKLMEGGTGEEEEHTFAQEQACLVEGLLRGFYKQVWPNLMKRYPTIIAVEQEMTHPISDEITFMSKPDLILADQEGEWAYIEHKSTSSKKEEWVNSWNTAIQLHSTIRAVETTLGRAPTSVIIQGLYKGFSSYGKQNSPFCYSYGRGGNPPFSHAELLYEYRAGYKRSPVWEQAGGVREWVDGMPEEILVNQFPQSPPIFIKPEMVDAFFNQVLWKESEIKLATGMIRQVDDESGRGILDVTFPQNFEACSPAWGHGCQFKKLCHGGVSNPLEMGFEPREAHHTPEQEVFASLDHKVGD